MPSTNEVASHLFACFNAVYEVLGEGAPGFTNDAYVVRAHDMGRAFGAVALELRASIDADESEVPAALDAVLRRAVTSDDTGAMVLYAMAMVLGPRLLISLLDARTALSSDEAFVEQLNRASQVVVAEILATGESAKHQAPIDDPKWQEVALALSATLDDAGSAESLGISR